jgi:dimethylamine/trimethylamine dehydrogenase
VKYTLQVLEAYEGEVAGAAYFDGLALAHPQQSAFFQRCAALERATASQLSALLRKYQLTPRAQTTLEERGTLDARREAGSDWKQLMEQSIKSYARYVTEFKALEAMAPTEDQPILAALTAHEIQLIEWMQAETGS